MKISDFGFNGVKILETEIYSDARGYFTECFNAAEFARAGLPVRFVLDGRSRSMPGVLRGLHFQYEPAQGKLVSVVRGRIFDVVVDIRKGSTTFGKHATTELAGDDGRMLWVPFGFAHGFCVIGNEPADVLYKLDAPYGPKGEGGIKWSDKELGIEWPVKDPKVSAKDDALPGFAEFKEKSGRFFR